MSRRVETDTAVGRREAGSGKMHEDGAPTSPRAPAIVISEHGHEIVEFIGPRQAPLRSLARQPDEPVVVRDRWDRRTSRRLERSRAAAPASAAASFCRGGRARPGPGNAPAASRRPPRASRRGRRHGRAPRARTPCANCTRACAWIARRPAHDDRSGSLNRHRRLSLLPERRLPIALSATGSTLTRSTSRQKHRSPDEQRAQDSHHRR